MIIDFFILIQFLDDYIKRTAKLINIVFEYNFDIIL